MCGRYTFRAIDRIRAKLAGQQLPLNLLAPRYNIAPSQDVLVLTKEQGAQAVSLMRWGLVPSWSAEPKAFINARAETLDEKPSFSESFQRRRCLVPADGFYEWPRNKNSRQPYYFQLQDEAPFAFAGIWDVWEKDGAAITSCAIVTTEANELIATIHDRMPVILPPAAHEKWLSAETTSAELKKLLVPFPAEAMKSYPVDKRVNYPEADDKDLTNPTNLVRDPQPGLLFEM